MTLKEYRLSKNYTQENLAYIMKISYTAICKYEHGTYLKCVEDAILRLKLPVDELVVKGESEPYRISYEEEKNKVIKLNEEIEKLKTEVKELKKELKDCYNCFNKMKRFIKQ